MTNEKIANIVSHFSKDIPADSCMYLAHVLKDISDDKYVQLISIPTKSPTTTLLLSIFLGGLGADRFFLGDYGVGVAKLLLGWLTLGIWPFIDIFISYSRCKKINMESLNRLIVLYKTEGN